MTYRSQRALIWWALGFAAIYGGALGLLLHMIPPPSAKLDAVQIGRWYTLRHTKILVGAVLASWSSAFMIPLSIVVAEQIRREEGDSRVWTWCALIGGSMTSIFLVLPPIFWGVAAFVPGRDPQVTAIMHELGLLSFVTTDQFYVFLWVAIVVACLRTKQISHSPFPRWFGYLCGWSIVILELGAFAFLAKGGPFAWNGLLVFWVPLPVFAVVVGVLCHQILTALTKQQADAARGPTSVSE